jgi:hypothetical protein
LPIAAPVDAVWSALRDPVQLRRWFGWEAEGLAEEIEDVFVTHAIASEQERSLRFDDIGDRFELEPRGEEETLLRLLGEPPSEAYDGMLEGWLTFIAQLRFALERHPGEDRRTLYLTGHNRSAGDPSVMAALGLAAELVQRGSPGDGYELCGEDGQVALAGELWVRSARQTAITVGGGDGLLVASQLPADVRPPHGGASACITSYGLSEDELRRMRDGWTSWWRTRFGDPTAVTYP